MSFPSNPTNGQQTTVNGIIYTYSTSIGAWQVATQAQSISLTVTDIGASGTISGASGAFTNVSGAAHALTAINASNIASGTLPSDRLSGTYTITVSGAATTAGTVTTAAQPNITSVGTLTSLAVTGNVTSGNVSGTRVSGTDGDFTNVLGNGAALTSINASNIASGTLPAARLSGTYTITVSGAATSATTAGTVTTAAQPNITSTGTLTSLSVTGNVTSGGRISASGTGGFASSTYAAGARNPIWRFGDADGFGLSYFQGSSGTGGGDTIGFHFGTATAAASMFQINQGVSTVVAAAHINPSATNTYDLGTSSLRWRNIYTQDLHLNNGIGDWTIVEGEDDLFLYNNKRDKVYKFNLTEVDPDSAVPKINELNKKS